MHPRTRTVGGVVALVATVLLSASSMTACGRTGHRGGSTEMPELARASGEPETHRLTVGALPITDLKQLFVADAEGFFQQEGLTVEIKNFGGGAEIIPAVEGGSVDVGWSNSISVLQARARGLTMRFFAGGLYQGPGHWTSAIMVPARSPIQRPEQLRGHNVAINNLVNINELVMRAYLDKVGPASEAPKLVELAFPDQPAALAGGRVDAAMPTEPFVTVAKQQGARVIEAEPFAAIGPQPFVAAFFSTDQWLREHPNTAAAFRRAMNQATRYWNDHPDRRAEIITRYTKVSLELARQITFGEPRTEIGVSDVQAEIALAHRYGLLPRTLDAHEVLTS